MSSKVYFTDFRCPPGTNQLKKLQKLIRAAGFDSLEMEKKLVAIKMHFGEPGNMAYLRPNWAKTVADLVKSCCDSYVIGLTSAMRRYSSGMGSEEHDAQILELVRQTNAQVLTILNERMKEK